MACAYRELGRARAIRVPLDPDSSRWGRLLQWSARIRTGRRIDFFQRTRRRYRNSAGEIGRQKEEVLPIRSRPTKQEQGNAHIFAGNS